MRLSFTFLSCFSGILFLVGCNDMHQPKRLSRDQITESQRVDYVLGYNLAKSWQSDDVALDINTMLKGAEEGQSKDGELYFNATQFNAISREFNGLLKEKKEEKAAITLVAGKTFLEQNKSKEDVHTTASGLQYKILKQGKGPIPNGNQTVVCTYNVTIPDGSLVGSTKHDSVAINVDKGVVAGWSEAIKLMPVGSNWELYIPTALAFGKKGSGLIPGNSPIIVDFNLIEITNDTLNNEVNKSQ